MVDVSIVGVWLGLEERDQFAAFLQQHNNDIPALVTHLQDLHGEAAQWRSAGPDALTLRRFRPAQTACT